MAQRRFTSWSNPRAIFRRVGGEVHPSILGDTTSHRRDEARRSRMPARPEVEADGFSSDSSYSGPIYFSDTEDEAPAHDARVDEAASGSDEEVRVDDNVRQDDSENEMFVSGLAGSASSARPMAVRTPSPVSELSSRDADVDENSDAPIGEHYFSRSPSLVDSLDLYDVTRIQDVPRPSFATYQGALGRELDAITRFHHMVIEDEANITDQSAPNSPRFVSLDIQLLNRNAHSAEGFFSETSAEESSDSDDSDSDDSFLVNTEPATPWSAHPDATNELFSTRTPVFRSSTDMQAGPSSASSTSVISGQLPNSSSSTTNTDKPSTPRTTASNAEGVAEEVEEDQSSDLRGRGGWTPATGYSCPLCLETEENISSVKCGHVFCTACIRRALEAKQQCPICRKRAKERHIRRIYLSAA